jgi:hypothetical protein
LAKPQIKEVDNLGYYFIFDYLKVKKKKTDPAQLLKLKGLSIFMGKN